LGARESSGESDPEALLDDRGVFGFGVIFQIQGSYAAGMVALIVYFVSAIPLAVVAGRRTLIPSSVSDHA
jgi:hypothetical protein